MSRRAYKKTYTDKNEIIKPLIPPPKQEGIRAQ